MADAQPKGKSSKGKYIGIGVGIGVVAIIVVVLASMGARSSNPSNTNVPTFVPTEQRVNLVNGIIGVPSGGYQFYSFSAPNDASNARVEGTYTASGGSGNDINIAIMDETAFTNWKNGHQVNVYYNSGQLTTGRIDASVPAGETLYLVYDNTFSSFTDKDVTTKADLLFTN